MILGDLSVSVRSPSPFVAVRLRSSQSVSVENEECSSHGGGPPLHAYFSVVLGLQFGASGRYGRILQFWGFRSLGTNPFP